ncbi:MAG: hypothetical protein RBJ76_08725 [Stenomitos frigidus ULC029]
MHQPTQTALVEWVPLHNEQTPIFSVYRSDAAIELQSGCGNRENLRLLSTHKDYDEAYEFCELLAEAFQLPIRACMSDRSEQP